MSSPSSRYWRQNQPSLGASRPLCSNIDKCWTEMDFYESLLLAITSERVLNVLAIMSPCVHRWADKYCSDSLFNTKFLPYSIFVDHVQHFLPYLGYVSCGTIYYIARWVLGFPPGTLVSSPNPKTCCRLIDISKLAVACGWVSVCVCDCALRSIQGVPSVVPWVFLVQILQNPV